MAITGNLNNLAQIYEHLPHPAWRAVFSWLEQIPLSDRDSTFIHPDFPTIKAYLKTVPTTPSPATKYESHQQHIDIHVCLSGSEIIQITPAKHLQSFSRHSQEDYILYQPSPAAARSISMLPGDVTILYPPDAHLPGLSHPAATFVQKFIVKLPLRLLH